MTNYTTRLETSVANSRIVQWLIASNTYRTATAIARAPQHASITRLLHTIARWTRASYLFRWLTKEPEPEVIVIDLRDTYTVAPFIAVLVWLISALEPAYRRSRLRAAGARIDRAGAWLAATRPGRLVVAALEPPEPTRQKSAAGSENADDSNQQPTDDGFEFPDR